jgi:hypothetical protein
MAMPPSLFDAPASEHEPPVERCGTAFTATAGPESDRVSHVLNGIAQADILVADEPGQTHAVGLGFALGLVLSHGVYLLIT